MNLDSYSNTESAKLWMSKMSEEKDSSYDPLITYLFINKNLKMSAGKIAAQSARVGQVMLLGELKHKDSVLLESLNELFENDFMSGNKTIALKANKSQLERILFGDLSEKLKKISDENSVPLRTYPVFDIGATEVDVNSLTMVALTPARQSVIRDFAKKFNLYS